MKLSEIELTTKVIGCLSAGIAVLGMFYLFIYISMLGFDARYFFPVSPVDVFMSTRKWFIVFLAYLAYYIVIYEYKLEYKISLIRRRCFKLINYMLPCVIFVYIFLYKFMYDLIDNKLLYEFYNDGIFFVVIFIVYPIFLFNKIKIVRFIHCVLIVVFVSVHDFNTAILKDNDCYIYLKDGFFESKIIMTLESGVFVVCGNNITFLNKNCIDKISSKIHSNTVYL